jgi:hypothetical protein
MVAAHKALLIFSAFLDSFRSHCGSQGFSPLEGRRIGERPLGSAQHGLLRYGQYPIIKSLLNSWPQRKALVVSSYCNQPVLMLRANCSKE